MEKITNAGKITEIRFCEITGAISKKAQDSEIDIDKADKKRGDVWLNGYRVEIKKAKQTINQARAFQYVPIVLPTSNNEWYVISAPMQFAIFRSRKGQHTPNAFICANLGISTLKSLGIHPVSEGDLKNAVLLAIKDGEENSILKKEAPLLYKEQEEQFKNQINRIEQYIPSLPEIPESIDSDTKSSRKCGKCGQAGHNKQTCKINDNLNLK